MIHHEQYKVLWNQYQLPNSDVKNGKVNTVFGFSLTISKFIMYPPWTLTVHSNIDVKNVVNYSHLNLIHLTKLFTKSKLIVDTKSQLVIQCVLHDYILVSSTHPTTFCMILHENHKTRRKVSQTLASHADIPRASTRGKELVIKLYERLQGRLHRNLSWRALGSCFLVSDLKTLHMSGGVCACEKGGVGDIPKMKFCLCI